MQVPSGPAELMSSLPLQVQNQLNAFIVLAALLWCVLAAVTMILQEHSTQQTVVSLWYAHASALYLFAAAV